MDARTDDVGAYRDPTDPIIIRPDPELNATRGPEGIPPVEPVEVTPMAESARRADESERADADEETPEAVREEIEQTREEMTGTIDEIQARLDPDRLKGQAKEAIHDATIGRMENVVSDMQSSARGAGNTIIETIRQNPVPAALVGMGLGWLLVKGRNTAKTVREDERGRWERDRWERGYPAYGAPYGGASYRGGYDYQDQQQGPGLRDRAGQLSDQAQDKAGQIQEKAGQMADQARGTAQQVGQQVQDTAQQAGQQVQYQARQAQGWLRRTMRENPLALGAVALAAGAAVGLSVPETQQEHQLMGPARDTLANKAQDATQDTVQRVQSVVRESKDAAQGAARDEAQRQGLGTGDGANATTSDYEQPQPSL